MPYPLLSIIPTMESNNDAPASSFVPEPEYSHAKPPKYLPLGSVTDVVITAALIFDPRLPLACALIHSSTSPHCSRRCPSSLEISFDSVGITLVYSMTLAF